MWIGVLWAGLRVSVWAARVGGKFRHGLLEKSLRVEQKFVYKLVFPVLGKLRHFGNLQNAEEGGVQGGVSPHQTHQNLQNRRSRQKRQWSRQVCCHAYFSRAIVLSR